MIKPTPCRWVARPLWLGLFLFALATPAGATPQAQRQPDSTVSVRLPFGASAAPATALNLLFQAERAAADGKDDDAVRILREAVQVDPNLISAWIGLTNIGLRGEPHLLLEGLGGALLAMTRSWEVQRRLLAILLPALLTACTLGMVFLLAGIGLRHLPRKRHILLEAFRPHLGRWKAGSVATLLCLSPLGVQWGLAATASAYAGLVSESLTRRERHLGLVALLWLLILPVVWKVSAPAMVPIDPLGASYLIERAQREVPTPELERAVSETMGAPDDRLLFAEGMLFRRSGAYDRAAVPFEHLSGSDGMLPGLATVNLGNLLLWKGMPTEAARHYERALDQPEARLEARYNLAIALSRLHRFEEADLQLDQANRLNFDQVRSAVRAGSSSAEIGVMDGMLSSRELWRLDASPRTTSASLPPLLLWLLPGGRLGGLWIATLGALLIGTILGRLVRRRLRVYECQHCGAPVCRKCVVRTAGHAYCSRCAESIGSLSRPAYSRALLERVLGREPETVSRSRGHATTLLPGIGPILRGCPARGLVLSISFLSGLILVTRAAWAAPPSLELGGLEVVLRWLGGLFALSAWVTSVDVARRKRTRRGVRHYFEKDVYRSAA